MGRNYFSNRINQQPNPEGVTFYNIEYFSDDVYRPFGNLHLLIEKIYDYILDLQEHHNQTSNRSILNFWKKLE